MGCASSVKVKPSIDQPKENDIPNGGDQQNHLSVPDARTIRKDENSKKLESQTHVEKVNIVPTDPQSSDTDSEGDPTPLKISQQNGSKVKTKKKKQSKKKKKRNSASSSSKLKRTKEKIRNAYEPEPENSESDNDIIIETHELKRSPQPLTLSSRGEESEDEEQHRVVVHKTSNSFMLNNQRRSSGDGKTDSQIETPVHEINVRASIDSVKLRTNANILVNDIMAQALYRVDKEDKQKDMPGSVNTDKENQKGVDDHAKNVVNQILSNALLVYSNETNSR